MMTAQEIIKKYDLDGKTWTYKGFHGVLTTFFPLGPMMINSLKDNYGESFTFVVFFVEKDYVHWYWNDEDMTKMRKSIINRVNHDPKYLKRMVDIWHDKLRVFDQVTQSITSESLKNLEDRDLLKLYKDVIRAYIDEFSLAIGVQDPFSMHSDRFLEPTLKAALPADKANEYFVALLAPVNESFINQELKARYKLLTEIQNISELQILFTDISNNKELVLELESKFPDFYQKLKNHVQKFHWLQNNYAKVTYLDEIFFTDQLQALLNKDVDPHQETSLLEEALQTAISKKQQIMTEVNLSQEVKNLIQIAETFAYMQDERKKYVLLSNYYQQLFRDEIGRRLNLTSEEMDYTVLPELISMLLDKKVNKEELKNRHDFCACFHEFDSFSLFTGDEARELYKHIVKTPEVEEKVLKGQTASLGKVTGTVRIIHKVHQVANMVKGDVLVATMTRPEMIVAINQASAIVTDEGGITSHAAVSAREFGIPCIVGTHGASSKIKTGTEIELDADEGVVKILKKK